MIYANFECLLTNIQGSEFAKRRKLLSKNRDALAMRLSEATEKRFKPAQYRGEDAVYVFLANILEEERMMQAYTGKKTALVMTLENWQTENTKRTDCYIWKASLVSEVGLDSFSVHHPDSGRYCGQSHRRCFYEALRKIGITGLQRERTKDKTEQWIAKNKTPSCSTWSLCLGKENTKTQ